MTPTPYRTTRKPVTFGVVDGEPVAFIDLLHNTYAIVDVECLPLVSQHRWYYNGGYVVAFKTSKGIRRIIRMHHLVRPPREGRQIDHKNRNPLDNRQANLRDATQSQNMFNTGVMRHNKSGLRGVCWHKLNKKWMAQTRLNGKIVNIGSFMDKMKAYAAYLEFNRKQRGEFADGLPGDAKYAELFASVPKRDDVVNAQQEGQQASEVG